MSRLAIGIAGTLVVVAAGVRGAQSPQPLPIMRQLAGTWTLVSIERPGIDGLTSLPFPRGLLVLDSAGHPRSIGLLGTRDREARRVRR